MNPLPSRIMVNLAPDASKALREQSDKTGLHPKEVATQILRRSLGLSPLCPQCDFPTVTMPDMPGVWFCQVCDEAVLFDPPDTE